VAEIEFNERYRLEGATFPAWLCDNPQCGYQEFVRGHDIRRAKLRRVVARLTGKNKTR
jgi:hypothetical protein